MKRVCVVVLACLLCAMSGEMLMAQEKEGGKDYLQAKEEDMQWWMDARFGMFIHWGPVSIQGTEIGWSRGAERRGRGGKGQVPVEVYDNLYKQFNPVKFDAREWVDIAKTAGMKYMVITSKHHDGFSIFDSKVTDYDIMASPFGRDIIAELAKACNEAGIRFGFYYSVWDWYHPDYLVETHQRYIEFMHAQLRELCSNYGPIAVVWFDGGGKPTDWESEKMFKMIRELQPGVLINNRGGLPADFDTPEQRVGHFQLSRPWETCMTICRQWAWKPDDQMKSLKQCIDVLVRCACGGGNLLFNVGPMPTGEIEPRQVQRLKEMGAWLDDYGGTIYGTRGGPFRTGRWGGTTYNGDKVFVHILDWSRGPVKLSPIDKKIIGSSVLTGGTATVIQADECIKISVPERDRRELDTIVVLKLECPASEIDVGDLSSGSLARGKKTSASNVYRKLKQHGPEMAFDDDPGTRWATDYGVHQAWLEVDLGEERAIGSAFISEAYGRVRSFELQYKAGEEWKTFAKGARIGDGLDMDFAPVKARHLRLNILDATEGPTIWEFHLFAPKK